MQRILQLSADDYLPAPCPLLARLLHSPSPPASPLPSPSPLHCIALRPLRPPRPFVLLSVTVSQPPSFTSLLSVCLCVCLSVSVSVSLSAICLSVVCPPVAALPSLRARFPASVPGLAPAFPARSPISRLSGWSTAH
jgi:hypothetical protein